jgi:CheY-like chemotaxis protein
MANIVLVEDHPDHRAYLEALLEKRGFEVRSVADGWWLLAALEVKPADLIIIDLYMPTMDGIETVRAVRTKFPHVPVIGITGSSPEDPAPKAFRVLGADVVIRKPIDEDELLALIRERLPQSAHAA